ncbi:MAG TPA: heme lyase CcmF/NrfE family subunit [bacterium]|nr:heme lyase CcmF/NrfE family subunit [bacterium]
MSTAPLGEFALLAALAVSLFGIMAGVIGVRRRAAPLIESSRRAIVAWAALVGLAALALEVALLTRQFQITYVAQVSSRDLPVLYTIAAFWGGHAGSLLLWALILGIYGIAAQRSLRSAPELAPVVAIVLLAVMAFFTALLVATSDPFAQAAVPPPDGRGLNPLLKNPWMAIHPPALYFGFVGMTVPFALGIAALVTRRLDQTWTVLARRWVLGAWLALTLGLLFGAKWSYVVLGWGGYWAWDPVENAALMPWLAATAFLHSIQVQERRGLLVSWTLSLIFIAFALSIFGTFLTRSGVVSSVHAFADSSIGLVFLAFLTATLVGSFGLLLSRSAELRTRGRLEALLSRESAFLANNTALLAGAAVVLIGTIFPILAEAVTGDRLNVGPPYFNQAMAPVVVLLLLLMGVGPLLPWRGVRPTEFGRLVAVPAALGLLLAAVLAVGGVRTAGLLLILALCGFVAATVGVEFLQGIRLQRARAAHLGAVAAVVALVAGNRRRYGGYVVHLGILLILVGVTASTAFATQTQVTLSPGESTVIGSYVLRYEGIGQTTGPGVRITTATLAVTRGGRQTGIIQPRNTYHVVEDQATASIGLRSTWRDDLYVVLAGWSVDRRATFRILVNPLVMWLWTGGVVVALGAGIAMLPGRRRITAAAPMSVAGAAVAAPVRGSLP